MAWPSWTLTLASPKPSSPKLWGISPPGTSVQAEGEVGTGRGAVLEAVVGGRAAGVDGGVEALGLDLHFFCEGVAGDVLGRDVFDRGGGRRFGGEDVDVIGARVGDIDRFGRGVDGEAAARLEVFEGVGFRGLGAEALDQRAAGAKGGDSVRLSR